MSISIPSIVIAVTFVLPRALPAQEEVPDSTQGVHYVRIFADSTGASHFADETMALALTEFAPPPIKPVLATHPLALTGAMVIAVPAGGVADWHPVPRRQINVLLSGQLEIEVSDGERRKFGPGSWIVGEDTTGQGHITRVLGSAGATFVVLSLPPN